MVLKALQQRSGAQLLAQPEVTTLSARQAQMEMTTIQRVVTGISERALTLPGITTTNGDESPLYGTEPMIRADSGRGCESAGGWLHDRAHGGIYGD